jgi:hypothetical protein
MHSKPMWTVVAEQDQTVRFLSSRFEAQRYSPPTPMISDSSLYICGFDMILAVYRDFFFKQQ